MWYVLAGVYMLTCKQDALGRPRQAVTQQSYLMISATQQNYNTVAYNIEVQGRLNKLQKTIKQNICVY